MFISIQAPRTKKAWPVQKIVAEKRNKQGARLLKVRWKGPWADTWEPVHNLSTGIVAKWGETRADDQHVPDNTVAQTGGLEEDEAEYVVEAINDKEVARLHSHMCIAPCFYKTNILIAKGLSKALTVCHGNGVDAVLRPSAYYYEWTGSRLQHHWSLESADRA